MKWIALWIVIVNGAIIKLVDHDHPDGFATEDECLQYAELSKYTVASILRDHGMLPNDKLPIPACELYIMEDEK